MKKSWSLFCLCIFVAACAGKKVFKDQFDHNKSWVELQTQLPEYPEQHNLIHFDARSNSNNQHFIDTTSIQVGNDGVVRYTLVIQSPSGATNVTFEGIRCITNERKLYALGHNDQGWGHSRNAEWQKLENVRQFDAQRTLYQYFFCPLKTIVKNEHEAINALRSGMHPRVKTLYQ